MNSLDEMKLGEEAIIARLDVTGSIRRRLLDIGMIEGTKVECVMKSPAGELSAYSIRGALIAIRKEDAKNIKVIS